MTKKEYQAALDYLNALKDDAIAEGEMQEPMVVAGFIKHMEAMIYAISTAETKPPMKKRKGFNDCKRLFVIKYNENIRHFGISDHIIELARKELGYSPNTLGIDIQSSLESAYKKVYGE